MCVREMLRRLCDLLERDFRRAVGAEQSVGFLKGIGELGVAKAAEESRVDHGVQQLPITVARTPPPSLATE